VIQLLAKSKEPFWNNIKVVPYLFILPNMILFLCFMIIPIFMTLYYSLVKWGGMGKPVFIGLDNYIYLISDEVFRKSVWITFLFTASTVPVLMILSLMFALLLNQKIKFREFFSSVLFIPSVISSVVVGMVFVWLFNDQMGFINYVLNLLGFHSIGWSTNPNMAMVMIIVGTLWSRVGYNMVIYLAALQGISPDYYEAATIDGANAWKKLLYITMPLLKPIHTFILITVVIHSFRSFDLIYVMTKGGPLNATTTLVMYVYDTAFKMNYYGRASASGVVLFLILLLFSLYRLRASKENI
jgi:multiple sugar transport system permease protein